MKKRILMLLLALALLAGLFSEIPVPAQAASVHISPSAVSGAMFTDNLQLAQKLDAVFAGNAGIYSDASCRKPVKAALGTSAVAPGKTLYVGPAGGYAQNSGESCWIYANGVYYTLFGEMLGNGTPGANSQKLSLSGTSHKRLTYENLTAWGVRRGVGAQVRVGTHSIIILAYDASGLTYVDGNGNGKGLIAVRQESWSEVKANSSIGGQKKVAYIIQPKQSYLDSTYPDGTAAYLKSCTAYPAYCKLRITAQTAVKTLPGGGEAKALQTLAAGQELTALGLYRNPAGEYWYEMRTAEGKTGYVSAAFAQMTQLLSDVSLTGVSAPKKLTQGQSFSLKGTVQTAYTRLTAVGAWVESKGLLQTGSKDAPASGTSFALKESALNKENKFGSLSVGSYTYCIRAVWESYSVKDGTEPVRHTQEALLYTADFTVAAAACKHSYRVKLVPPTAQAQGYAAYTCKGCGHSFQERYVTCTEPGNILSRGIWAAAMKTVDSVR